MQQARRELLIWVVKRQDIQAALLAIVEQEIGKAVARKISAQLLVIGTRRQAQSNATVSKRPVRASIQRGIRGRNPCQGAANPRQTIAIDAGQFGKERGINRLGEIDETHLTALELRLIDIRHIISVPGIHGRGIAIILIGDIEILSIGADPCHEGHVPG